MQATKTKMKQIVYTIIGVLLITCPGFLAGQEIKNYEVGIEGGVIAGMGMDDAYSGSAFHLTGAYFMSERLGFRSGASLLSGIDGADKYWKIPLLFSYRFPEWEREEEDLYSAASKHDFDDNILMALVFLLLPRQLEINAGPSLGYITPDRLEHYYGKTGKLEYSEDIRRRFASSFDLNFRLGFPIGRVKLNVNIGFNYLMTKNFIYQTYGGYGGKTDYPAWSGDIRFGGSFTF